MRRTRPRSKASFFLVSLSAALLLASARTSAQPEASAAARADALYKQAGARIDGGEYQEAIPILEDSLRLKPTGIGARFRLADCYEHAGQLDRARQLFQQVAQEAGAAGKTHLEEDARARAEGLLSRSGPASPPAALAEKPSTPSPPAAAEILAVPSPPAAVALPLPAGDKVSPVPTSSAQRTVGLALGGVGLAGLAAGVVLGVQTLSKSGEMKRERACTDSEPAVCTAHGYALYQQASTTANLSTWMFAVGGAAVIAGVVTFVTARPSRSVAPTSARWHAGPVVSAGTAGLTLQGEW